MVQSRISTKRIAPGSYDALTEALSVIFWSKGPFERFLRVALRDHPELLAGLSFSAVKRQVASDLVLRLAQSEDRYQSVTLDLMLQIAAIDEFPNLRQQPDKGELIEAAERAVDELRKWTAQYGELAGAREKLEAEREAEQDRYESRRSVEKVLGELKDRFLAMHGADDPQRRGRIFEDLLNDLFFLFDLNPRRSFRLADEQIDGAFTFSTDDYLLEAKWEKQSASRSDVDVLAQKVSRKSRNTLGLFVAVSGFSEPAVRAHADCGGSLIFLDGTDLFSVLDGLIPLVDVLESKRRHLSETGQPLRLVRDMLS